MRQSHGPLQLLLPLQLHRSHSLTVVLAGLCVVHHDAHIGALGVVHAPHIRHRTHMPAVA